MGAICIGLISGFVCQWFTTWIKFRIKIDDSLDVFAVHGIGGIIGTLLVAVFAAPGFGGLGLAEGTTITDQLQVQVIGILSVALWSGVVTWIIAQIIARTIGLRVSEESEIEGLDIIAHGERGYDLT